MSNVIVQPSTTRPKKYNVIGTRPVRHDGADKVTTAATTINSLTLTDKTYALSAGSLSPGDVLDVRITVAITDTATPTAVLGWIGGAWLQCDVRG